MKKRVLLLSICIVVLCGVSRAFGADGWASQNGDTIGGEGGTVQTVTTAADFKTYVEAEEAYIVQVSGPLDFASIPESKVRIKSNKTITGIGTNPTIIGQLGFQNGSSNVIIEKLNITCPSGYGDGDGINLKEDITNVFITKCTLYDCLDGCLDITRRSDYITVSWCKFYFTSGSNPRVSLVGGGDTHNDEGTLHITFHHNWFSTGCWQRIPSVRFGRVHIYNNYYNCPGNLYCVRSRIQAECLIENNYFLNVNDPYYIYIDDEPPEEYGKIGASGNILIDCTGQEDDGDDIVFAPPYTYSLDGAEVIPAIVQYGAGADGQDGYPPHWFFGLYGDFDLSGMVDANDITPFAGYWLATENIEDADYDGSGRVDSSEFALFAGNYWYIPPDTTAPEAPVDVWALGQDTQAVLDWTDNSEEDFAGYNVYRSTTSGSGYTKLNESLLSSSEYTDVTALNDTMYYYVITAVDTNVNESGHSVEACAVPNGTMSNVIIQENATGFCGIDGIVDTSGEHSGFTGIGYLDTTNVVGSGINWEINAASAGNYALTWRFANGSSDRPARLLINDIEKVASIDFPATGAWENWTTASVEISLSEGIKEIRLEATTSGGCANIDYLKVAATLLEAATCP